MVDIEHLYSDRAGKMRKSEIRELLRLTQDPEIISFAGGLPNPMSFPIKELESITATVLQRYGKNALQYGPTHGINELRQTLAERACKEGIQTGFDNVIITSGSQQSLDMVAKMFTNPGDVCLVAIPSYLGGINAFRSYEANMVGVPIDHHGMKVDLLEDKIRELRAEGHTVKTIYAVPNFSNPDGTVMPENRRKQLVDLACEYDLLILEDDPYGKLRYDGTAQKPIKAFDDEGRVIYISTFSKILAPGFRLAWMIADEPVIRKMAICKQALDLCTAPFTSFLANSFIETGSLDLHIMKICEMYKPKRDIMVNSIKESFPEGYECWRPHGGMFAWVTLPKEIDTELLFLDAIKEKVAYVHGKAFCVDGGGASSMRLNFSYSTNEQLQTGIQRLGSVIEKKMKLVCK
jgi:2-aminoadipate transaminase